MNRARFLTETGTVIVSDEGIMVPRTAGTMAEKAAGRWASLLGQTRTIPYSEVHSVAVGAPKAKFMTGNRVAGIVTTGGLALIGPHRTRATLAIATQDGVVLEFKLLRKDAKRSDAIALAFASRGVTVV
jgi:hypothetical protein